MYNQILLSLTLFFGIVFSCHAQEASDSPTVELQVLKDSIGVWDLTIHVWAEGPDSGSIEFIGVETNRAYGEHWIASDFQSEFLGRVTKVHSIVGYDLDEKKLVGTVVDSGPYAAKMTGVYDRDSKTVQWTTKVKGPDGNFSVQKTAITQVSPTERFLVLSVPNEDDDGYVKFMEIRYVKRM